MGSPLAMRGRSATSATLRATRTALLALDRYTVLWGKQYGAVRNLKGP